MSLNLAIDNAFQRFSEGALPLEAVEVTAALTAIIRPKDYGCHPIWDVGLALGAIQLEGDDAAQARAQRSKEAAAGARIALLGAGGSLREYVVDARPIVFQIQHLGLPWAGMD